MSGQERIHRPEIDKTHEQEHVNQANQLKDGKTATAEDLKDGLDELLDEIDGVLEENAEEFVRSYIQKGGE